MIINYILISVISYICMYATNYMLNTNHSQAKDELLYKRIMR